MIQNKFFTNLKTLSKIKINDKIHINSEKYIIVEVNSFTVGLYRRWNNINRHTNIIQLKEIYNEIFVYINNQLDSKFIKSSNTSNSLIIEKYNDIINELKQFIIELQKSKFGLINLKETYNNDRLFESKVDNILLNIDNYINKINKTINIYNNHYVIDINN